MKLKLAKDRVAITEIDQEIKGELVLPSNAKFEYQLGKLIEVPENSFLAKGQIVLFQMPPVVKASTMYKIKDKSLTNDRMVIMHQNDIIGTLKENIVALENFTISGNWILLEMWFDEDPLQAIVRPENFTPPIEEFRFKIVQKGSTVDNDMYAVGDEVFIERQRCNPIMLSKKEYCFLEKSYVYGVRE